jgi:hypothetical protein
MVHFERRQDVGVRMAIGLRLAGTDAVGNAFDASLRTHDVSRRGFSCDAALSLPLGHTHEARMLFGSNATKQGEVRVVHVAHQGPALHRYGFEFLNMRWLPP